MLPTIAELRAICQGDQSESSVMYRLERRMSIYVTWALLHTPITANEVTFLFLAFGLLSALLFAMGGYRWTVAGAVCLQLQVLLDFVDGEVARYRRKASRFGVFFEIICHQAVFVAVFAGMSYGVYRYHNPNIAVFAFGFSAGAFFVARQATLPNRLWAVAKFEYANASNDAQIADAFDIAVVQKRKLARNVVSTMYDLFYGGVGHAYVVLFAALMGRIDVTLYVYGVCMPVIYLLQVIRIYGELRQLDSQRS